MTVDKFDPIWGESGTKTPVPSDSKIGTGWVSGTNADRPSINYLNYLQHRAENKINELADELICNIYDPDDTRDAIATGLWNGMSDIISGGATKAYVDMCAYVNSDNESKLLVLNHVGNLTIDVYDARTMTLEDTSDDLIDDLPSGGGQTWNPLAICTDGTHVYVHFHDSGGGSNNHQVQSWLISDWSVNTGWAATGTQLTTTGNITSPQGLGRTIICASATKLAVANKGYACTAAADPLITILTKSSGAEDAYGSGDSPTADSVNVYVEGICSDGTNIFFGGQGTANDYLCSATIADPTTGCGGAGYPLTLNNDEPGAICYGKDFGILATFGNAVAATDYALITFNASDAQMDVIEYGTTAAAAALIGDNYFFERAFRSVFDGVNFWLFAWMENRAAAANTPVVIKIDSSKLLSANTGVNRQLQDIGPVALFMDPTVTGNPNEASSLAFDGRDIWCIFEEDASQTYSGKIFRIPGAYYRS